MTAEIKSRIAGLRAAESRASKAREEHARARNFAAKGEYLKAIKVAQGLVDEVVRAEERSSEAWTELESVRRENQALRDRVTVLTMETRPKRIAAAFVDVSRLVLAETTWRKIWDRSVERSEKSALQTEEA